MASLVKGLWTLKEMLFSPILTGTKDLQITQFPIGDIFEDSPVSLRCHSDSDVVLTYQWSDSQGNVLVDGDTLEFKDVKRWQSGVYTCNATDATKRISRKKDFNISVTCKSAVGGFGELNWKTDILLELFVV